MLHLYYRLSGVWLAYPGTKEYALQDISLTIPKGSLLAIVGPEACGKTTIARVILGIIKPQVRVCFRHMPFLHFYSFKPLRLASMY
jgi:ABC-type protease/lipase transport system fused ATPase/permease subunit